MIERWKPAGAVAVALLASGCFVQGCATNPATGETELSLIGEGQEVQMGREADPQIVASIGLYEDESIQRYVDDIGQRLAAASERPDLPWTFRVLDDPAVNAFAVPGGFIYITRGILTHLNSEAELAGILGHEIGHVTARHSVSQMSKAQLTQLGVGLGMIFVPELRPFADAASAGMQLLFLKYGRDDENQADELGVRYMTRLGYAPAELADVMQMLERASSMEENRGRVPEWLSTHPDPANRVSHIIAEIDELPPDVRAGSETVRREQYLRRIDGMVFGADPREGFFRENVFYHPELRFQLAFPRGWQSVNQKQAVQAISPDQDAAILLTLEQGSPSQALRQFESQQGIRVSGAGQESVNGIPGVAARFSAATQQGTLEGMVLFLEYGGNTYRLMGYGPQSRWRANERTVGASLGSFDRVTDPSILNARPDRVDLVGLDRSLSFRSFLERYPSAVRPELVALINHVQPDDTFRSGMLVKRVAGG